MTRVDNDRKAKVSMLKKRLPYLKTDKQVAEFIGASPSEYAKWKADRGQISHRSKKRLCEISQIQEDWLDLSLENYQTKLSEHPFHKDPSAWSRPRTPTPFIGRQKELKVIKKKLGVLLGDANDESKILSIHGVPGVGKSTIAAWLANDPEVMMVFSDAVLWTVFGRMETSNVDYEIRNRLKSWGGSLKDDHITLKTPVNEMVDRIENLLLNQRALLICDDIWHVDQITSIRRLADRGVRMLLTSRFPEIARAVTPNPTDVIELKVFDEADAVALLKVTAPEVVEQYPNEANALVKDLENLPLAINVAGHLLRRELDAGLDVVKLISELRREGEQLLNEAPPLDMMELITEARSPTVAAWLKRSIQVLDEDIRRCFISLGAMAARPATFGADTLELRWGANYRVVIRNLVDKGLVQFTNDGRYQMHALLVTLARSMRI